MDSFAWRQKTNLRGGPHQNNQTQIAGIDTRRHQPTEILISDVSQPQNCSRPNLVAYCPWPDPTLRTGSAKGDNPKFIETRRRPASNNKETLQLIYEPNKIILAQLSHRSWKAGSGAINLTRRVWANRKSSVQRRHGHTCAYLATACKQHTKGESFKKLGTRAA